jgi:hypothetical protein
VPHIILAIELTSFAGDIHKVHASVCNYLLGNLLMVILVYNPVRYHDILKYFYVNLHTNKLFEK